MSKAFTRESDEDRAGELPAVRPPLPAGTTNYITQAGAERLQHKLKELFESKRAAGKEAGSRVEAAIRRLQSVLNSAVVRDTPADRDHVAFGASVTLRYENGEEEEYRIVGIDETEPAHGLISWLSPLAKALVGKKAGDTLQFRSPAGIKELTVVKVRYQES